MLVATCNIIIPVFVLLLDILCKFTRHKFEWISILHAIKVVKNIYLQRNVLQWIRKLCWLLGNFSRLKLKRSTRNGTLSNKCSPFLSYYFFFFFFIIQAKVNRSAYESTEWKNAVHNGFQLAKNVSAVFVKRKFQSTLKHIPVGWWMLKQFTEHTFSQ